VTDVDDVPTTSHPADHVDAPAAVAPKAATTFAVRVAGVRLN